MGILACLEPQHPLALPDSPPELVSEGSSSSFSSSTSCSSRKLEDLSRLPALPISPPMSNYDQNSNIDMSTGKSSDEAQTRKDVGQPSAPRQQLPSLSSLFGPQPPVRPLHSPLSDRPNIAYASTSPRDRPLGPPAPLERSFSSSSYFPSTASPLLSQPRSAYETGYQPLPRTSYPGAVSPQPRDPDHLQPHHPRSDYGPGGKWTSHSEPGRSEYSFGARDQLPFKPAQDRYPPQLAGQKHEHDSGLYRDARPSHGSPGQLPPTPSSTVTSEGIPAKDGLGPKIWTGTHFLPRFVRAAEVPGEGTCYFYDDGSHCKTVIDGEAVNAHWGVTKAGKPRKRLAIACVTCREKKIKCDPDFPRCVQCEKFGRICKFKNAPRGGHNTSPGTPPAEPDQTRRLGGLIRPPPESPRPGSTSSASVSPRTAMRPVSPEARELPAKRMRISYDQYPPMMGGQRSPLAPTPETARSGPAMSWQQPELPRIHEDVLLRAWQTDPYVSDPQSVNTTIASFFVHFDSTALRFLPERAFKAWIQSSATAHNRKSSEDLMLVYSILALGAALSGGPKNIAFEYAQVARFATDRAGLSIQLVQARLLMALYYLSASRPYDSNDMLSGAISAAACLQLHLEMDRAQEPAPAVFPYGLSRPGYVECRRRTFWACFILERLNGLFPVRPSIINPDDIFIHLPCDNKSFEEQTEVATPAFEPYFSSIQHQQLGMGIMGYLVQIVAIWGDVLTSINRTAHRNAYFDFDFIKFHHSIISRVEDWRSSLPPRLASSNTSPGTLAPEDEASFTAMYLVYHRTMIKLHRHIHSRFLTSASRIQYLLAAQDHARKLVKWWCGMAESLSSTSSSNDSGSRPESLHSFASYALVEATDVLSAEGSCSQLPSLMQDLVTMRTALAPLGVTWAETQVHCMALDHRLDRLSRIRELGPAADSPGQGVRVFLAREDDREKRLPAGLCWQLSDPMEVRFPRGMDCVYNSLAHFPPF